MKIYFMPGACSMVPHTALEWIGKPYEMQKMDYAATKSAEYLALNPQGTVPLLVNGDFVQSQNIGILFYLDNLYPQANIFGSQHDVNIRAKAMRWLALVNSDLHSQFGPLFHIPDFLSDEDKAKFQALAIEKIHRIYAQTNEQLAQQDYLAGMLSIADVYLYVTLRWAKVLKLDLSEFEHLAPFFLRIANNAGVQKVVELEGIPTLL